MSRLHTFEAFMPGNIPIRVHLIIGDRYAILIDTAMKGFERLVEDALGRADTLGLRVPVVVNTHAHHDHMGLNGLAVSRTKALLAGAQWGVPWLENRERNYREFALSYPDIIADSPALRAEVLDTMDQGSPVDILLHDGDRLRLGHTTVEIWEVPGHVLGELAFYIEEDSTLVIGDALTGIAWPQFHGHLSPTLYRNTLRLLHERVQHRGVDMIVCSHLGPMIGTSEIHGELTRRLAMLDAVDDTLRQLLAPGPISLETAWHEVSSRFNKKPEFRGLATVAAHLEEMVSLGQVIREGRSFRAAF